MLRILSCLFFLTAFCSFSVAQNFTLPPMPSYDSVYTREYGGNIWERDYYKKGKRVMNKGYNPNGSMLDALFFAIGGAEEDSCYAYVNRDQYELYYFSKKNDYIVHEKFAENSLYFHYKKMTWKNVPIETGSYYFIKEMHNTVIAHNSKYKIGEWKYYNNGQLVKTINYNNGTVNGKPFDYSGNKEVIALCIRKANAKLIEVYGQKIFSENIRLNIDRSGASPYKQLIPEVYGGISFLDSIEGNIEYVTLSYDFLIGDHRFNVISIRMAADGTIIGKKYLRGYDRDFYLTQGLDLTNKKAFHPNVTNWKAIALKEKMDITSKGFNVRFKWQPGENEYGTLQLVLEETVNETRNSYSYTRELRQIIINPWTGEYFTKTDSEGMESIGMPDEGSSEK